MDGWMVWIAAIVVALVGIIIIAIIVEVSTSGMSGSSTSQPGVSDMTEIATPVILGQRHDPCNQVGCGSGLICTTVSGQNIPRCLSDVGELCSVDTDCATGLCYRPTGTGTCRSSNTSVAPTTRLYYFTGSEWIPRLQVPMGLVLNRVASSGGTLIGVSTASNQLYLWDGSSWATVSIPSPGRLVDATLVNGTIWAVYTISSGQTAVYTISQGRIEAAFAASGGIATSPSGNSIQIASIEVTPDGTVFIVGSTSGSMSMVYRQRPDETTYSPISLATHVVTMAGRSSNDFAFASGSSILVLGSVNRRQDEIAGRVVDVVVTPDYTIWYITQEIDTYILWRDGVRQMAPIVLSSQSRLYYSHTDGVSIFTPGY